MAFGNILNNLLGSHTSATGRGGLDTQEKAVTGAKNKGQSVKMSTAEQQAYTVWKKINGQGTREQFMALPKQERDQYKITGSTGNGNSQTGSLALSNVNDTFTLSNEARQSEAGDNEAAALMSAWA